MNILVVPTLILMLVWGKAMWAVLSTGKAVSPLQGWMVGLSYFAVAPLLIIVLNGGYSAPSYYGIHGEWATLDLDDERFLRPFFVVWLTLMMVAITALFLRRRANTDWRLLDICELDRNRLAKVVSIAAGLTLLDIAINIHMKGGLSAYFLAHWYTRDTKTLEQYGQIFVLYQFFGLGLQLVLTASAGLCMLKRMLSGHCGWPLGLALVTMIIYMIATGNRIYLALFILYVAAAAIFHKRYRTVLKMALLAPLFIVIFAVWAQVRSSLSDPMAAIDRHVESAGTFEGNYVLNRLIDVTEGTSITLLFSIIRDFGREHQFLSGLTLLKSVTFWIPRSVYEDKPEGFTVISAELYEPGEATSLNSTVMGELYANFGYFTLLFMPLLTVMAHAVERVASRRIRRSHLTYSVLFLAFAWMARASFSDILLMMGFAMIVVWGLGLERNPLVTGGAMSRLRWSDKRLPVEVEHG